MPDSDPTPATAAQGGLMLRLINALTTRRCRGCSDSSFHTHHLTWLGRRRYT